MAFLESEAKIKVLACGRRWGKTDACAASIVEALHRETPTRHVILAPTLDQARLLFDRVVGLLRLIVDHEGARSEKAGKDGKSNPIKHRYTPHPALNYRGHRVIARSGHLGRLLRGNEATHIIVDEAAFVPEELISEVALPMLATTNGQLTLISTPRGKNHFWRYFEMGLKGENGVWSKRSPSSESPYVRREFLAVQQQIISERAFKVEYEAEFIDAAGRVFATEAIDRCLVGVLPRPTAHPYFIGIDWARYADFTAVAVLSGSTESAMVVEVQRFTGLSWSNQVVRVQEIVSRYPGARILCDATGNGDAVLEQLQEKTPGIAATGLVFNQANKTALIENIAMMIDQRRLAMTPHPDLLRELEHFEGTVSENGGTRYSAPSGYHDDLVVALALAASLLKKVGSSHVALGAKREFSSASKKGDTNDQAIQF